MAAKKETTGIQLESHQVIRRPLVTEKGMHASERWNAYSFEVHPLATKEDIKKAFVLLHRIREENASPISISPGAVEEAILYCIKMRKKMVKKRRMGSKGTAKKRHGGAFCPTN